ncbi:MAG: polysaccharide deacetylase family protein [Pirellulaceae bacterium]
MTKPVASLSLDLDNKWSYLKTHGDAGWDQFPTYLPLVVPRFLKLLRELELTITVFVVGQDAALPENHAALASIAADGHEIGNHSFHHEPWLHLYSRDQLSDELARAEQAIQGATGYQPVGFRGPGYSRSSTLLQVLAEKGYRYDASTFPTFLGPLARAYYFFTAHLDDEQRQQRKQLFGRMSDGFLPLRPYVWRLPGGEILELPVTTMPWTKTPIHLSYLLYLYQYSPLLARNYFRVALRICRVCNVSLSLLLHPLDFLGGDDEPDLSFFPAMKLSGAEKVRFVGEILAMMRRMYDVRTMRQAAEHFRPLARQRRA